MLSACQVSVTPKALASIAAGKKDLSIRNDLNTCERMNRFDRWMAAPLAAPEETREDVTRLFRAAKKCVQGWIDDPDENVKRAAEKASYGKAPGEEPS